jgi:hypothetical protein
MITLSASQDQIAWVLTAYIVASAIATPLTGCLKPSWISASRIGCAQAMRCEVLSPENRGTGV